MLSSTICVDINECSTRAFSCPTNAGCMNTVGSYTCRCNTGFESSGSSCVGMSLWSPYWSMSIIQIFISEDINECSRGLERCHAVATCTNTIGSYSCACPSGTAGNGFTCTGKWVCFMAKKVREHYTYFMHIKWRWEQWACSPQSAVYKEALFYPK